MKRGVSVTGLAVLASFAVVAGAAKATAADFSGQRQVGNAVVEPAYDDADGDLIFLLTPTHGPFPSASNPASWAPMYLPVYPTTTTIDPATLNCQPTNCDHVNVLPFPAPGYVNGGTTCQTYGFPAGGCALLAGHDHLVGLAQTGGDFNVPWQVHLIVFTQQGFNDGAINNHLTTLDQIFGPNGVVTVGDAIEIPTSIVFNCSAVSETTYLRGTAFAF